VRLATILWMEIARVTPNRRRGHAFFSCPFLMTTAAPSTDVRVYISWVTPMILQLLASYDDHGSTIYRCACLHIVGHANDPAAAHIFVIVHGVCENG